MSYQTFSTDFSAKTLFDKSDDLLTKSRTLSQSQNGSAFGDTLDDILVSPNMGTTLKPSSGSVLSLKREDTETYGDKLQSRINDFKMLENNAPSQTEWNKAFKQETDDSGWSLLEGLGSGLLTVAKIAGAVALL